MLAKPLAECTYLSSIVSELYDAEINAKVQKLLFLPHFSFPWGRPWGNHAKCCVGGKRIRWSQIVSQHVRYPSIFNSFADIRTASAKKSPFSRTAAHIFVSPGDAPGAITLNVIWMDREFDAYNLPCWMCPSNYNRFSDKAIYWSKIVIFSYPLAFDAPVRGISVGTSPPRLVRKN